VETRISRDVLPHLVPHQDAVFNVQRVSLLIAALYQGRLDLLESAMQDRLHQPYRERLVGPLKEVFEGAMSAGARGVCLSGAGPSVVALCTEDEESIGEAMRRSFEEREIKCRSIVLKADQRGIQIRSYQKSSGR
jgi:homoserine kinase